MLFENSTITLRKDKGLLKPHMHPPPFNVATAHSAPKKARHNSMDVDTDQERHSSRSNSLISEESLP